MHISGCIPHWANQAYRLAYKDAATPPVEEPNADVMERIFKLEEMLSNPNHKPQIDCVCENLTTLIALIETHCAFEEVHGRLSNGGYRKTVVFHDPARSGASARLYNVFAVFARLLEPNHRLLQHARLIDIPDLRLIVTTNGQCITEGVPQVKTASLHLGEEILKFWEIAPVDPWSKENRQYLAVDKVLKFALDSPTVPDEEVLRDIVRDVVSDIYDQFGAIVRSIYKNQPDYPTFQTRVRDYRERLWDAPSFVDLTREWLTNWLDEGGVQKAKQSNDPNLKKATGSPESADREDVKTRKPRRTLMQVVGIREKTVELRIPSWSHDETVSYPLEGEFAALRSQITAETYLFGYVNFGARNVEDLHIHKVEVSQPQHADSSV